MLFRSDSGVERAPRMREGEMLGSVPEHEKEPCKNRVIGKFFPTLSETFEKLQANARAHPHE